jgi:RNA polymerase-binding transcription factor DksA
MFKVQLDYFRQRLLSEKEQLEKKLLQLEQDISSFTREQYQEGSLSPDVASEMYEQENLLTQREEAKALLSEITTAIQRIENGTFGNSVVSGKPIPLERLEILPWAEYLVEEEKFVKH